MLAEPVAKLHYTPRSLSATPLERGDSKRSLPTLASRTATIQMVEQMLAVLDQRVTHVSHAEDARVQMLSDQTQRLLEGLSAMRASREIHEERRAKELRMVESNVMMDLNKAKQSQKEIEARAEEITARCIAEHQEELTTERLRHQKVYEETIKHVDSELKRISEKLEEVKAARSECGERVLASLEAEFHKIQEAISMEQKMRFDSGDMMKRMVEDTCGQLRADIQKERVEREAVQGRLLGLLEETCNRIETSFAPPQWPPSAPMEPTVMI